MPTPGVQAEIDLAVSSFRINEAELAALLTGPQGEIYADLTQRAIRVQNAAIQNASGRPGPNVRTGRLRGSITYRLGSDSDGPYADVGSNVYYAPYVELGHRIVVNGQVVGWAPSYPFLQPALSAAQ